MEEKSKRRGYKTQEQQNEANKRYRATEKGKEVQRKSVAKSQTKKYINEFATFEELEEVERFITERKKILKNSWHNFKVMIN